MPRLFQVHLSTRPKWTSPRAVKLNNLKSFHNLSSTSAYKMSEPVFNKDITIKTQNVNTFLNLTAINILNKLT